MTIAAKSVATPSHTGSNLGLNEAKRPSLTPSNYKFLQQEIYRQSGIVLDEDKHYLLESRLLPLVRSAKFTDLDELCARLRMKPSSDLSQQVMEALTTNETLFFRDMAPFEVLKDRLLPEWWSMLAPGKTLNIWSAAASSGQEAYSIAMLLREAARQDRRTSILGTDISEQILGIAREGKYVQFEVNRGLPAKYLVKYFNREGLDWRLKDEIRTMVHFQRFDLRQPTSALGRFHIIFCRNVLIYFDVLTKSKILKEIAHALEPGGYLVLGGAESIMDMYELFERTADKTAAIYRRR